MKLPTEWSQGRSIWSFEVIGTTVEVALTETSYASDGASLRFAPIDLAMIKVLYVYYTTHDPGWMGRQEKSAL